MFRSRFWGTMMALVLLVVPMGLASAHTAAIRPGMPATTTTAVNMRSGPGLGSSVTRVVPSNARVAVDGGPYNGTWFKVSYNGTSGYMFSTYLRQGSSSNTGGTTTGTRYATDAVMLRGGPGTSYSRYLTIPAGAKVAVTSGPTNGVWYKVSYNNRTGYVHGDYLSRSGGGNGGAKRIVVDLSDQRAYAYEGGEHIFTAPTVTGKNGFRTPTGSFRVQRKYREKSMRGTANGESWYAASVPYILFFTDRGHALHGAPWTPRSVFGSGQRRSHGCVNLPVSSAKWFYDWAPLGTPVRVQQ